MTENNKINKLKETCYQIFEFKDVRESRLNGAMAIGLDGTKIRFRTIS